MATRWTLTDDGIVLATAMLRKFTRPARVLLLLSLADRDDDGWRYLSDRLAGRYLGGERRNMRRALRQLELAGVLERRPGAGSRPDGWRVEGRVIDWRVEWVFAPDHVGMILRDEIVPAAALSMPIPRLWRHAWDATSPDFVASSSDQHENWRTKNPGKMTPQTSRGSRPAASPGGRHKSRGRGVTALTPQPRSLLADPTGATKISALEGESLGSRSAVNGDHGPNDGSRAAWVEQVAAAIFHRTGAPALGRLLVRLDAVAGQLTYAQARTVIDGAPDHFRPPLLVEALEQAARSGGVLARPGPAAVEHVNGNGGARRPTAVIYDPSTRQSWRETFDNQAAADEATSRLEADGCDVAWV